jgi:hypothetical protein
MTTLKQMADRAASRFGLRPSRLAARSITYTTPRDITVAWYTKRTAPGLFKDILPAWNDSNLRSLAAHIRSRLFFAQVVSHEVV